MQRLTEENIQRLPIGVKVLCVRPGESWNEEHKVEHGEIYTFAGYQIMKGPNRDQPRMLLSETGTAKWKPQRFILLDIFRVADLVESQS